ncbi:DUF4239 domain-containing protein [bacterium]|nr:DUF4239 domain-containing protein [bacterium]
MGFFLRTALLAFGLFIGMLIAIQFGKWLGVRRKKIEGEAGTPAIGVMEGSVFALMGLVIAFTFSGALGRLDWRRQLDVEEVNAIGTAWLRLDLLPERDQPPLRRMFREYAETRLGVYHKLPDVKAAYADISRLGDLQKQIWSSALASAQSNNGPQATMLLMPALNAMFDILTTQKMAGLAHPPLIVFAMLFGLAVISSLLVGYDMGGIRQRHWIHLMGFAATIAFALYVVVDLEYPRLGLIRIDHFDQAMVDLLAQMK